jgi:pilus assembly protein Flp/PilA
MFDLTEGVQLMFAARRKLHREEGQGLVEYALILVLVAVVVVVGLTMFGGALNNTFLNIASSWPP